MSSQLLEAKLKALMEEYSDSSGVTAMVSDMVEILSDRKKASEVKYNKLVEKDPYIKELIDADKAVIEALNNALDELEY